MPVSLFFGVAFILLAVGVLTSPYWLLKELQRSDHEELPAWMGDARARKRRLIWISGIFTAVFGTVLIVLSIANR